MAEPHLADRLWVAKKDGDWGMANIPSKAALWSTWPCAYYVREDLVRDLVLAVRAGDAEDVDAAVSRLEVAGCLTGPS